MPDIRAPHDCTTMAQVRAGVDAVDRELVALLGCRFGYMRAAARIKTARVQVRDETRKAQVIDNARNAALGTDLPLEIAAALYEQLVEASIAFELDLYDRDRGTVT